MRFAEKGLNLSEDSDNIELFHAFAFSRIVHSADNILVFLVAFAIPMFFVYNIKTSLSREYFCLRKYHVVYLAQKTKLGYIRNIMLSLPDIPRTSSFCNSLLHLPRSFATIIYIAVYTML